MRFEVSSGSEHSQGAGKCKVAFENVSRSARKRLCIPYSITGDGNDGIILKSDESQAVPFFEAGAGENGFTLITSGPGRVNAFYSVRRAYPPFIWPDITRSSRPA